MNRKAVVYALISAALFGVSTPAAKLLVGSIHPVTLAGLLYCGAGIGVAGLRRIVPSVVTGAPEIAISRAELPWLAAAIGAGGVVGPLLLMFGLARTNGATASLLLTLEGVATVPRSLSEQSASEGNRIIAARRPGNAGDASRPTNFGRYRCENCASGVIQLARFSTGSTSTSSAHYADLVL